MVNDLYEVIHRRRDVRGQFTGNPVPVEVLDRILAAAHAAPSVGLSQPWDFILVRDRAAGGVPRSRGS
jgi:5,6-dimethylbenzimidazole synthase